MDSEKLIIKQQIIQQTPFYKKRKAYQRQRPDQVRYFSYEYNMKKIYELKLQQHLQFNIKIFGNCHQIEKGYNLNTIKKQMNDNNQTKKVIVNNYECRLNQFVEKYEIDEAEALEIVRQIIEAVYCVVKSQFYCFNIRAENFVGVRQNGTKKFRWKLDSVPLVFIQRDNSVYKTIQSPMVFKSEYQPPQAYLQDKKLRPSDLQESLVWNIGCIWLHILYGKHYLYDYQMIKKFCLGNGADGIHSLRVLGIQTDKITIPECKSLLQSMLQFESFRRMQLKTLFSNSILAGNIRKFQESYFKKKTSDIYNDASNILQFQHNYDNFDELLIVLVKKSNEANLDYKFQEKNIIQQIVDKDSKFIKKKGLKTKIIPRESQQVEPNIYLNSQKIFTYDQIKQYLRSYKFYYDKAIFIANCTEEISRKLQQILQKKKFIITMLSPSINGKKGDLTFTFHFVMNFMRLIYLQILLQNLKLYRNVFNIPNCTYNIANSQFKNTPQQWQLFNDTALYHAFSIYVQNQFKNSQNQLIKLFQKNHKNQFISQSCKNKISELNSLNYKVCTIYRFLPHYQKVLKDVLDTIDQFSICRPDFRRPSEYDPNQIATNMKNIGLLLVAYFIQNQKIFSQQYYNMLFGRYLTYPMPIQPQFIKSGYLNLKFSRKKPKNILQQFMNGQIGEKGDYIFNFESYQKFLVEGDTNKVSQHVRYLLKRLKI